VFLSHLASFQEVRAAFCLRLGVASSGLRVPKAQDTFSILRIPAHSPTSLLVR